MYFIKSFKGRMKLIITVLLIIQFGKKGWAKKYGPEFALKGRLQQLIDKGYITYAAADTLQKLLKGQ